MTSLTRIYVMEVLRWASKKRCKKNNCGTVCLCEPCAARRALEELDPDFTPT